MCRFSFDNYEFVEHMSAQRRAITRACHEAAHAIAAYHYRVPFHRVRVGKTSGGELILDTDAIGVAKGWLQTRGLSLGNYWRTIGTVIRIAKRANIDLNCVNGNDANYFAQADDSAYQVCVKDAPAAERSQILDAVLQWRDSLIQHPGFRTAVGALAHELNIRGEMTDIEVKSSIDAAVGRGLDGAPIPSITHEAVSLTARERWLAGKQRHGNDWGDWFTAERAHRFFETIVALPLA